MRYKKGDKVVIKNYLKAGYFYDGVRFDEEMVKFKNKVVTIADIIETLNCYTIEEDNGEYNWTVEMFAVGEHGVYDEISYLKGKIDAYEGILAMITRQMRLK